MVNKLVERGGLIKQKYSRVHFDSPNRRRIDVALHYRKGRLEILGAINKRITLEGREGFLT